MGLDKEGYQPSIKNFKQLLPESDREKVDAIMEEVMAGEKKGG